MTDMNIVIAHNISNTIKMIGKNKEELAIALGYSKQVVGNMLSGARSVTALELKQISDFCNVPVESIIALPEKPVKTNVVLGFVDKVKTEEAKEGIRIADKLIDMYLFHSSVNKQGNIGTTVRSSL